MFCETAPLFVFLAVHNVGHDRKVAIRLSENNGRSVRIADIYVFSCEGPVWVNLLFKQRFIDVHCYQLCQAEELL